jgi:hypothetical protein
MPRHPEDDDIEVQEGVASEYGEATGEESVAVEIPDSVFDQRQRAIGTRRKPAGPPLRDDGDEGLEHPEAPDVPPTTPRPAPEREPEVE